MKPLILLTNDDGIHSPGLMAAAEALAGLGRLLIAAPQTQQTAMGRSFPRADDLGILERVADFDGLPDAEGWAVHGSPAWSVAYGVLELAGERPALCVSGINYGENMGQTIGYSGTLGAAFEANSYGIPSVALSLETSPTEYYATDFPSQDWSSAQAALRKWAGWMLSFGSTPPADTLNINLPAIPLPPSRYRITHQSRQNHLVFQPPGPRDRSQPFRLRFQRQVDAAALEPDSDLYAVCVERVTSVTPMQCGFCCGWKRDPGPISSRNR
ncbi:MAG: 5'/3'-nucleotidase SurE [Clostridiales bacterium]|nr:5'/3'-nucleotidase SurE [Clostridiales bacterium]